MTTQHVCKEIIKPLTKSRKSSYISYLNEAGPSLGYIMKATCFVSYPRQCKFLNLVKAISEWAYYRGTGDDYFWIDIFSVQQHEQIKGFDSWKIRFKQTIKKVGRGIAILSPWDAWKQSLWQERAWCLYEYYLFASSHLHIDFVILTDERKELIRAMERGRSYEDILSLINIESAEASLDSEATEIKNEVKDEIGFGPFNQTLRVALKRELVPIMKAASDNVKSEYPLTPAKSNVQFLYSKLLIEVSAGNTPDDILLQQQGYVEAEQLLRKRLFDLLGGKSAAAGVHQPSEQPYLDKLAALLPRPPALPPPNLDKARENMRVQRRQWRRTLGLSEQSRFSTQSESDEESADPLVLADTMQKFAEVCDLLGKSWDAAEWLQAAVKLRADHLGPTDPLLAESRRLLADALRRVGRGDDALKALASDLGKARPDEPVLAADASASMANMYLQARRYEEAEELYRSALQEQVRARGATHPSVAETLVNLGAAQRGLDATAKALATYARAERILREHLKVAGPLRLASLLRNMGAAHAADGDSESAVERYEEAAGLQRLHTIGGGRAALAETLAGLARARAQRGEHAAAVELHREALREREALLSKGLIEAERRAGPDVLRVPKAGGAPAADLGAGLALLLQGAQAATAAVLDAVRFPALPRPDSEDVRRCGDPRLRPLYAGAAAAQHSLGIALMHAAEARGAAEGTGEYTEAEELLRAAIRRRAALAESSAAGTGRDETATGAAGARAGEGEAGAGAEEELALADSLAAAGALLRRRREFNGGRQHLERALWHYQRRNLRADDRRVDFVETLLN